MDAAASKAIEDGVLSDEEIELSPEIEDMELTPFELELYFKEQARKRRDEMAALLQAEEEVLELPEGDYTIQVGWSSGWAVGLWSMFAASLCRWTIAKLAGWLTHCAITLCCVVLCCVARFTSSKCSI